MSGWLKVPSQPTVEALPSRKDGAAVQKSGPGGVLDAKMSHGHRDGGKDARKKPHSDTKTITRDLHMRESLALTPNNGQILPNRSCVSAPRSSSSQSHALRSLGWLRRGENEGATAAKQRLGREGTISNALHNNQATSLVLVKCESTGEHRQQWNRPKEADTMEGSRKSDRGWVPQWVERWMQVRWLPDAALSPLFGLGSSEESNTGLRCSGQRLTRAEEVVWRSLSAGEEVWRAWLAQSAARPQTILVGSVALLVSG